VIAMVVVYQVPMTESSSHELWCAR